MQTVSIGARVKDLFIDFKRSHPPLDMQDVAFKFFGLESAVTAESKS
jgi:hypothetical protein